MYIVHSITFDQCEHTSDIFRHAVLPVACSLVLVNSLAWVQGQARSRSPSSCWCESWYESRDFFSWKGKLVKMSLAPVCPQKDDSSSEQSPKNITHGLCHWAVTPASRAGLPRCQLWRAWRRGCESIWMWERAVRWVGQARRGCWDRPAQSVCAHPAHCN